MDVSSSLEKSSRRVRFSLPEAKLIFPTEKRAFAHLESSNSSNGSLINITAPVQTKCWETSNKSAFHNRTSLKTSSDSKTLLNVRPNSSSTNGTGGGLFDFKQSISNFNSGAAKQRSAKPSSRSSFNGFPTIERKSSSLDYGSVDYPEKSMLPNLTKYKSSDDLREIQEPCKVSKDSKVQETQGFALSKRPSSNYLKVPYHSCNTIMMKNILLMI